MAAKQIVWSLQAQKDWEEILRYWETETGNIKYSTKLARLFKETLTYIAQYNYFGRPTDIPNVWVATCKVCLIYYRVTKKNIEVVTVFDGRRNPDDLKDKL